MKRILKTPSFDFKKDVFKKLSEFCGDFDFSNKTFEMEKFLPKQRATLVLLVSEEGQCPSGEFLHTDADISLRSRWYPQWQACMPCTPGGFDTSCQLSVSIPRMPINANKLHSELHS